MFGRAIYDRAVGDLEAVRARLGRKQRRIRRYAPRVYVETSHAFLKSYWDLAPEFFPGLRVVHLVRNPLAVARSEANREALIQRLRIPFRHYRGGDGRRYFRWALTGLEPIFAPFDLARLTPFQRYLIQWIEIENRAVALLERDGLRDACFTMRSPQDLRDPARIAALLGFLGLEPTTDPPRVSGVRNRTPGQPTIVGAREEVECREIVERLPDERLAIFRSDPYRGRRWSRWLWR